MSVLSRGTGNEARPDEPWGNQSSGCAQAMRDGTGHAPDLGDITHLEGGVGRNHPKVALETGALEQSAPLAEP